MLNTQQLLAVHQIEGPVMVIAGPGTGKTQILASRIANILKETDSKAQNILCLTFTDAGSAAMRKRLVDLVGNDAHRISIHTFHSFCNRVIQENQSEFNYRNLQPVSELERIEILQKIATELDQNHALKNMKGNVGYLVSQLKSLFGWMKKENISAEEIQILCDEEKIKYRNSEEVQYKVNTKNARKGDLKMHLIEKFEADVDDFAAGAKLFTVYQDKMQEIGRYDYDDMILWVLDLFERSPNVLQNYQERFHYFLIDEFQDTNGSQNKLIQFLINYWDNPNIFVVGDDDQSIYRFQGAEIKNVVDFAHQYQNHLHTVLLNENYRSTQSILNAAKVHIDQNHERLVTKLAGLEKTLKSNSSSGEEQPTILSFKGEYEEAIYLGNKIRDMIAGGTKADEIAVIYRNHQHAEIMAKVMNCMRVPVYFHKSENALEAPSVLELLNFLRYISAEIRQPFGGEEWLFGLMHLPRFGLRPLTNAKAAHVIYKNRLKWRGFFAEVERYNSDAVFNRDEVAALVDFGTVLEELIAFSMSTPLIEFVAFVVQKIHHTERFALNAFQLECLRSFLDFVEQEARNEPSLTLTGLLEKIDLMEIHDVGLPKEHILFNQKGVRFMTAHASKGLEFEHVFVINCLEKTWEKDRKSQRPYGFINLFSDDESESGLEESRRLFYVAMTRAKNTLNLSYHQFDANGKDLTRSSFLDHLIRENVAFEITPQLEEALKEEVLAQLMFKPHFEPQQLLDDTLISAYLSNYQLSVSHLNAYLTCPTAFYFEHILRIPSSKNKYMSFGTAIHKAMDLLFKAKGAPEFSAENLRKWYENSLYRERHVFRAKEYDDFLSLGKETLTKFFDQKSAYWLSRSDLRSEVVIERVESNGVPIKGQIDLMDVDLNNVQVIDFKTGDAGKSSARLKEPREGATADDGVDALYGGSYWRQMMFYAILIESSPEKPNNMVSGVFEFVEPDKNQNFPQHRVVVSEKGLSFMKTLVSRVYQQIQQKQFLKGCGDENCRWCAFVANLGNKSTSERLPL